ncbi:MAG TPA: hypothetical protein V6D10_03085 [Trichocoleus sp.]
MPPREGAVRQSRPVNCRLPVYHQSLPAKPRPSDAFCRSLKSESNLLYRHCASAESILHAGLRVAKPARSPQSYRPFDCGFYRAILTQTCRNEFKHIFRS